MPAILHGDEKEPLDFTLNNVEISPKEGFEDKSILEAINFSKITFNNVKITGYKNPTFVLKSKGEININNSGEIFLDYK